MCFITNICRSAEYAFLLFLSVQCGKRQCAMCDRWSHLLIYINSYPIRYWIERVCLYVCVCGCIHTCACCVLYSLFPLDSRSHRATKRIFFLFRSIYIFIESLVCLFLSSLLSPFPILFWLPLERTEDKINSMAILMVMPIPIISISWKSWIKWLNANNNFISSNISNNNNTRSLAAAAVAVVQACRIQQLFSIFRSSPSLLLSLYPSLSFILCFVFLVWKSSFRFDPIRSAF